MQYEAVTCHSLKGRRLYGQIQETLYGISVSSAGRLEDRESVVGGFVRQAQEWYVSSPLKVAFAPLSQATIKRQVSEADDDFI